MTYLPDTNACIVYLNSKNSTVRRRMQQLKPGQVYLCSVVKAELLFGAIKSNRSEQNMKKLADFFATLPSVTFDDYAAIKFGEVRTYLERGGTPIGPYDLQIASIALANNFIVVTNNINEFSRVPELRLDNWERS